MSILPLRHQIEGSDVSDVRGMFTELGSLRRMCGCTCRQIALDTATCLLTAFTYHVLLDLVVHMPINNISMP